MNCHAVAGTPADGRFGPDLTHLMSRATIAAAPLKILTTISVFGSRAQCDQTWLADARHEAERRGPGCGRELHGDAALEQLRTRQENTMSSNAITIPAPRYKPGPGSTSFISG